eukprot:6002044-Lingulodinium_polyedra.AAC.1
MLTYTAYLLSRFWELAQRSISLASSRRRVLRAPCSWLQTALGAGRYGLAWLFAGLNEPPWRVVQKNTQ